MAIPSASYSITVRLEVPADPASVGLLTTAVGTAGGIVTALDVTESHPDRIVVDVTCAASDQAHAERLTAALGGLDGVTVRKVSDRTFLLHLGGKIEVRSKVPLRTRDDLSMAYTPGVARVCLAIARQPEDVRRLTVKRNTVAVVSDGSAVLGLGNLGAAAALPVMEGKAALFKRFADIDAWPLCLDTQDVDEIVRTVQLVAPVFGGINLEDIAAPRCFEVERQLRELLDIPVFHDDQHGTAIVVLAALTNALRVVGKALPDVRIVLSGAGAAGSAIARLLLTAGARDLVVADVAGVLHADRADLDLHGADLAARTNPRAVTGTLRAALAGADVFIGVSAPGILDGDDIATMAERAIVFALANPDPEVDPAAARRTAAVVATGRSDEPNQINNVLAFPGVFRGLLDAGARHVDLVTELAAARALADVVRPEELNASFIVPSVFDPAVASAVAGAVRAAAQSDSTQAGSTQADSTQADSAQADSARAEPGPADAVPVEGVPVDSVRPDSLPAEPVPAGSESRRA
ncbi:MAG: NAD-dependent malic enzyme [Actinomycetota bacterium]|nr:NAD-dependent malic enzyme [Actinomycetota bacterium]